MSRLAFALCLGLGFAAAAPAHGASCPNLVIVLDRSSSMHDDIAGNQMPAPGVKTRWEIAVAALRSVIMQYDGKLPLGFGLFPSDNSSCNVGPIAISPDYGTRAQIESLLTSSTPPPRGTGQTCTPTYKGINQAAANASLKDPSRQQYILLITDGEPNCNNNTCANNSMPATLTAIDNAFRASPSITTYVVGFGGNLPLTLQENLDSMADSGRGAPVNNTPPYDYYAADSEQALLDALRRIITIAVGGGDAGSTQLCDDSCYSNPCPNTTDVCIAGMCKANPCDAMNCPEGEYCYFDGLTAQCLGTCQTPCEAGNRCVRGQCQPSSCGTACSANTKCSEATQQCEPDPACSGVLCKTSQGCFNGTCQDNPCTHVKCPANTECVAFEGTCQIPGLVSLPPGSVGGCSCDISATRSNRAACLSLLLFLFGVLLVRRRIHA